MFLFNNNNNWEKVKLWDFQNFRSPKIFEKDLLKKLKKSKVLKMV